MGKAGEDHHQESPFGQDNLKNKNKYYLFLSGELILPFHFPYRKLKILTNSMEERGKCLEVCLCSCFPQEVQNLCHLNKFENLIFSIEE